MKKTFILIIILVILGLFGYKYFFNPSVVSVNIVNLAYEESGINISDACNTCFNNQNNPATCVGSSIKSNFNLQMKNYKNPVYCKVVSDEGDLTNPFLSYNGLNDIQDAYGEQLLEKYKVRVCCSTNQDLSDSVCSEEKVLDERCLLAE